MGYLKSPDGTLIIGTLEMAPGTAYFNHVTKEANGAFDFDYSGETEMHWNGQETVTRNGQTVVVDEDYDEYLLSDCTYHEGNPEDEDAS